METAPINGISLAYEVSGKGEPVVTIHGALIADTFQPLMTETSLTGRYRLVAYHRRGYGGSSHTSGPISLAQQAADCRALLRHLGVERAHVVGHSLGGCIAIQLALDAPEVVQSLTLIEPALMVGPSGPVYRESLAQAAHRYRDVGAAAVVDEFLQARWPGYRAALDRILPGAFAQAVGNAETSFEYELPGLLEWQFGEAEARRIGQPVLSILGGASKNLSPRFEETHQWVLASLPHAESYVLPGTTHLLQVERPGVTAKALADFFARHPLTIGT